MIAKRDRDRDRDRVSPGETTLTQPNQTNLIHIGLIALIIVLLAAMLQIEFKKMCLEFDRAISRKRCAQLSLRRAAYWVLLLRFISHRMATSSRSCRTAKPIA